MKSTVEFRIDDGDGEAVFSFSRDSFQRALGDALFAARDFIPGGTMSVLEAMAAAELDGFADKKLEAAYLSIINGLAGSPR